MSTMCALSPLHSLGGVSWLQRSKARPMSIQEEREIVLSRVQLLSEL